MEGFDFVENLNLTGFEVVVCFSQKWLPSMLCLLSLAGDEQTNSRSSKEYN